MRQHRNLSQLPMLAAKPLMAIVALGLLQAAGCVTSAKPELALRQVVLYQNGIGYFEHTGRFAGETLQLRFRQHELNDALKTLAIVDQRSGERLQATSVLLPPLPKAKAKPDETVPVAVHLGDRRQRELRISYAVTVPAWRASYRLILDPDSKRNGGAKAALLQAWAVVDNASGEDWRRVAISLEAAAPLTFATDLRTPQFLPRPDATGALVKPAALGAVAAERAIPGDMDGDGVLDADDLCPGLVEDRDGFEDQDGCPDPDNDQDRILDVKDMCPGEPETYNGYDDEDGCPDKGRVVVQMARLEILDKIYFAAGSAEIREISLPILDAIAATLAGNPQIKQVAVQGHAATGEAHAWALSSQRAANVQVYLRQKGVTTGLKLQPMGTTLPVDRGANEDARSKNRRVEFSILEQDDSEQAAQRDSAQATSSPRPRDKRLARLPDSGKQEPRYELPSDLSVKRGESMMVSIINKRVAGEDVLLFRPDPAVPGSEHHPFHAARLKNDSGRILVPGPVAIYARGSFVGEALLERLNPGETALLPYALDSSIAIQRETRNETQPARLLTLVDGVCTVEDHALIITRYQIQPGHTAKKQLVLRQPRQVGYTLADAPPGSEATADAYLIPLPLASAKDQVLEVKEQRPARRTLQILAERDAGRIGLYLDQSDLLPHEAAKLRAILALQKEASRRSRQLEQQRQRLGDLGLQIGEARRSLLALAKMGTQPALRRQLSARLKDLLEQADEAGRGLSAASAAKLATEADVREALRELQIGAAPRD